MHSMKERLEAAQALAGCGSLKAFSKAINLPDLSDQTLKRVKAGTRNLKEHEVERLAEVAKVGPEFFTGDLLALTTFGRPPELAETAANGDRPDEVRALAQRVDGLRADLEVLAGEVRRRNGAAGRSSRGRTQPGTPE